MAMRPLSRNARTLLQSLIEGNPGDTIVYGSSAEGLRRDFRDLAWSLHEAGAVHLVQKRNDLGEIDYMMIKKWGACNKSIEKEILSCGST